MWRGQMWTWKRVNEEHLEKYLFLIF